MAVEAPEPPAIPIVSGLRRLDSCEGAVSIAQVYADPPATLAILCYTFNPHGRLAQWLAQVPYKHKVGGSSPSSPTNQPFGRLHGGFFMLYFTDCFGFCARNFNQIVECVLLAVPCRIKYTLNRNHPKICPVEVESGVVECVLCCVHTLSKIHTQLY